MAFVHTCRLRTACLVIGLAAVATAAPTTAPTTAPATAPAAVPTGDPLDAMRSLLAAAHAGDTAIVLTFVHPSDDSATIQRLQGLIDALRAGTLRPMPIESHADGDVAVVLVRIEESGKPPVTESVEFLYNGRWQMTFDRRSAAPPEMAGRPDVLQHERVRRLAGLKQKHPGTPATRPATQPAA